MNDNNDPNVINPSGFVFTNLDYEIDHLVGPWRQKVIAAGAVPWVGLQYVDFDASAFEHWSHRRNTPSSCWRRFSTCSRSMAGCRTPST